MTPTARLLATLSLFTSAAHGQVLTTKQYAAQQAAMANEQLQAYVEQDPGTDSVTVSADGDTIIYKFVVPEGSGVTTSQADSWGEIAKRTAFPRACTALQETGYYDAGLAFRYNYTTTTGRFLTDFTAHKRSCNRYASENTATCMISRLSTVQNDAAARAAIRTCEADYQSGLDTIPQGIGRHLNRYRSGDECTVKNGSDTPSEVAAIHIRRACNKLYSRSSGLFDDLMPAR